MTPKNDVKAVKNASPAENYSHELPKAETELSHLETGAEVEPSLETHLSQIKCLAGGCIMPNCDGVNHGFNTEGERDDFFSVGRNAAIENLDKPKCQQITPEDSAAMAAGDYNAYELFGATGTPSCPGCPECQREFKTQSTVGDVLSKLSELEQVHNQLVAEQLKNSELTALLRDEEIVTKSLQLTLDDLRTAHNAALKGREERHRLLQGLFIETERADHPQWKGSPMRNAVMRTLGLAEGSVSPEYIEAVQPWSGQPWLQDPTTWAQSSPPAIPVSSTSWKPKPKLIVECGTLDKPTHIVIKRSTLTVERLEWLLRKLEKKGVRHFRFMDAD